MKIFSNARKIITDNGLDINGLTALGSDNTNVNMGEKHSVYTLFNEELPCLIKGKRKTYSFIQAKIFIIMHLVF